MTTQELVTNILRTLGEEPTAPVFWTRAEILGFIDDAQTEFVRHTGILVETTVLEVLANRWIYPLPTNCIRPIRVLFDNKTDMRPLSAGELDLNDSDWETQTGTIPEWFYHYDQRNIYLTPRPDTSGDLITFTSEYGELISLTGYTFTYEYGVITSLDGVDFNVDTGIIVDITNSDNNLQIWYVKRPESLVTEDIEIEIPEHYHKILRFYALKEALLKEGEDQKNKEAGYYENKFYAEVAQVIGERKAFTADYDHRIRVRKSL